MENMIGRCPNNLRVFLSLVWLSILILPYITAVCWLEILLLLSLWWLGPELVAVAPQNNHDDEEDVEDTKVQQTTAVDPIDGQEMKKKKSAKKKRKRSKLDNNVDANA